MIVAERRAPRWGRPAIAAAGVGLLLTTALALRVGSHAVAWRDLVGAGGATGSEIVRELRMPRVLSALLVGAALAVAGALMQALTRNRLAGPSLMGLGPGATLGVLGALVLADPGALGLSLAALAGAAAGGGLVFAVAAASERGATPERMVLAGAIVGGLLTSLTGIVVLRLQLAEVLLYWTMGGLGQATWPQLWAGATTIAAGMALAAALARPVTVLLTGEATARSLGVNVGRVRALGAVAVLLLAGGAVALAGPVGFVGVLVPNACRRWSGPGLSRLLPLSALAGAWLVLAADLAARALVGPIIDVPLGVMTALLGAPAVVAIALRGARSA